MEYWSMYKIRFRNLFISDIPILHYSITPLLRVSQKRGSVSWKRT
jgi:hypothetical protein